MPTRRQERVAKRVMQELVEAVRDLKYVDLGFITITRCEISPDLRHAKVFVSVWGDEERQEKTLNILRQNATRLKSIIGRPLGTKVVPSLHFEFDDTIATTDEMSRLIRDARATDSNPEPMTEEEAAALAGTNAGKGGRFELSEDMDPFEAARLDVEEELLGDGYDEGMDDDPDWRPINLDELPDDGDEEDDG